MYAYALARTDDLCVSACVGRQAVLTRSVQMKHAQKEVFSGDGQFRCGNQACKLPDQLSSYEMNFVYKEDGAKKEALVKLRLCPECGVKLNYRKLKEREKEIRKEAKVRVSDVPLSHTKQRLRLCVCVRWCVCACMCVCLCFCVCMCVYV